jgi:maltose alpha-D-glucosyltransferase/alpha-amylase
MIPLPAGFLALLRPLYGDRAAGIKAELEAFAQEARLVPYLRDRAGWHHAMHLYTVYPDGIRTGAWRTPLRELEAHVAQVARLNCNAMHVLPFWESPMADAGFDISDHFRIRPGLGTMADLLALRDTAERAGIHLFMDAVTNHVSDRHDWFRRAQAGEEAYRARFLHCLETPRFLRKLEREGAVAAEYEIPGAGKVIVDIAFPQLTGLIPHWRLGVDGVWYYHTYYPQELDLDWANPDVFTGIGKVLLFWGSLGFNFRLDAIPFVGRPAYKLLNGRGAATHALIRAFRCLSEAAHPHSVLLAETFEKLEAVMGYFGAPGREEAHFAYNFHLCAATWVSLVAGDAACLSAQLRRSAPLPPHAQWVNFLRNHDELSLAHLPRALVREVHRRLLPYGKDFGEGHGLSGRTFSLLGSNPARFRMAYFLLASLPGSLMVIYGDELATGNRKLASLPPALRADTRNIARGTLGKQALEDPEGQACSAFMARLLGVRRGLGRLLDGPPRRVRGPKGLFHALYRDGSRQLRVLVNLSAHCRVVPLDLSGWTSLLVVNDARVGIGGAFLGRYAGLWLGRAREPGKKRVSLNTGRKPGSKPG